MADAVECLLRTVHMPGHAIRTQGAQIEEVGVLFSPLGSHSHLLYHMAVAHLQKISAPRRGITRTRPQSPHSTCNPPTINHDMMHLLHSLSHHQYRVKFPQGGSHTRLFLH